MSNTGKSSNGGDGGNIDGDDDDDPRPILNVIKYKGNRRMLAIIADFVTEAKVHSSRLDNLYQALKDMDTDPSPVWGGSLLSELERHHDQEGVHIGTLRSYLQAPSAAAAEQSDEDDDED